MASRSTLATIAGEVAEALLPQRCIVCDRFGAALHDGCVEALVAAPPPRCDICWAPIHWRDELCERCATSGPAFDGLRAAFRFVGDARRELIEAKFRGVTRLIEPLAHAAALSVPLHWDIDVVVLIPLNGTRERRRGYNQAEIAARVVAGDLGVPLERSLLRRATATEPQAMLSAERRASNLSGAFSVDAPPQPGVLLVDDITTTGATFEEAAGTLRRAGAASVYALALARED